jgi:hypothetical protein
VESGCTETEQCAFRTRLRLLVAVHKPGYGATNVGTQQDVSRRKLSTQITEIEELKNRVGFISRQYAAVITTSC